MDEDILRLRVFPFLGWQPGVILRCVCSSWKRLHSAAFGSPCRTHIELLAASPSLASFGLDFHSFVKSDLSQRLHYYCALQPGQDLISVLTGVPEFRFPGPTEWAEPCKSFGEVRARFNLLACLEGAAESGNVDILRQHGHPVFASGGLKGREREEILEFLGLRALSKGQMGVLRWLVSDEGGFRLSRERCHDVLSCLSMESVETLDSESLFEDDDRELFSLELVWAFLALKGRVEELEERLDAVQEKSAAYVQFLISHLLFWAARGGQVRVMSAVCDWARCLRRVSGVRGDSGPLMVMSGSSESVAMAAAARGHICVLEWLREQCAGRGRPPWDVHTTLTAASKGQEGVLRWLRSQETPCPWDFGASRAAIRGNHLQIVRFMLCESADPCPTSATTYVHAVAGGNKMVSALSSARPDLKPPMAAFLSALTNGQLGVVSALDQAARAALDHDAETRGGGREGGGQGGGEGEGGGTVSEGTREVQEELVRLSNRDRNKTILMTAIRNVDRWLDACLSLFDECNFVRSSFSLSAWRASLSESKSCVLAAHEKLVRRFILRTPSTAAAIGLPASWIQKLGLLVEDRGETDLLPLLHEWKAAPPARVWPPEEQLLPVSSEPLFGS
uniref:Uncharacterized protein n=1 Tax=Chromera velia CCMP2878 TaxID=1169474 RepID=A0A0G4HD48_9ALVE|eukprot:Cvel_6389.t1-p1 / transcript=Cvel_6389.t1 / gene=Cvel_6389 / organism=Chromera_velia_CCMP2878 / gene_product=hypothetical protein / transcript_product=hypothetical protein / location=Cvel_scaffold312:4735-6594(-) / protein_length=620 / sequence_SO=supercontig / SO=protein_coding / is_pseudo=false